jgi:hypothetical protein
MTPKKTALASLCIAVLAWSAAVPARGIYVSPSGNDQNAGNSSSAPFRTIAKASAAANAGDTVFLMPGNYQEAVIPVNSGTAGQPITYKSLGPTPAVISNVNVGIFVNSLSYLVFDGINVNGGTRPPGANVNTFVAIQNSNHITVQNGNMQYANGWAGIDINGYYAANGKYWEDVPKAQMLNGTTTYVTIQDNTIDGVGDYSKPSGDVMQVSWGTVQHILVQRNTLTHGGHDLVEFDPDYGVFQNNVLNNSYTDWTGGDTGYRSMELRGTYNVVQYNFMEHSRLGGGGYVAPLASIRGNDNVVRNNVLYDSITASVGTWCGVGNNDTVTNGRIYGNTLYQAGGEAWDAWAYGGCTTLQGFVFANNLVVNSRSNPGNLPNVSHGGTIFDADLVFEPMSGTGGGPSATNVIKGNLFAPSGGAPAYVLSAASGRQPLSSVASQNPQSFISNVQAKPVFVTGKPVAQADFQLQPGSPGLAQGVFLTTAVGSGTSNTLTVQDSLYFSDGNGFMTGDVIELQGTNQQATIVSINRSANTLTLSSAVTFKDGQGVALPYNGASPDIGSNGALPINLVRPLPPGNLGIQH